MHTKPSLLNLFMAAVEIWRGADAVEDSGLKLAGAKAAA
jgi:hypothetical protein